MNTTDEKSYKEFKSRFEQTEESVSSLRDLQDMLREYLMEEREKGVERLSEEMMVKTST